MPTLAPWNRSTWTDAGQLAALVDPDAVPDQAGGRSLPDWFDTLRREGRLVDAVQFVAHALPRYECVVWAAQALLETGAADRKDPLMVTVLRWIDDPSDQLRRQAGEQADAQRKNTPARLLAEAVLLSGGSLAPEDLPPIQPPPDVCAKLAGAAVIMGAYELKAPEVALQRAMELGEAAASGK